AFSEKTINEADNSETVSKQGKPKKEDIPERITDDPNKDILQTDTPPKEDEEQITDNQKDNSGLLNNLIAHKKQGVKPPYVYNINIEKQKLELSDKIFKISGKMRHKEEIDTLEIDIPCTIKNSIKNFGLINPVYKTLSRHIEFLMLIDWSSEKNHQAQLYENIYQDFKQNNLYVDRFFFNNDPRICWNENYKDGIKLETLQLRHPEAFMLYFSKAEDLIYILKLEPYKWTNIIREWKKRILFTPETTADWGKREEILKDLFSVILPATTEGILEIEKSFSGINKFQSTNLQLWKDKSDFFDTEIYIENDIDILEYYYSNELREWIIACSVYPELNWDLTLYIGKLLSNTEQTLVTQDNLMQINRLNWFREGKISENLRFKLLQKREWFSESSERKVRTAISNLLSKDVDKIDKKSYAYSQFLMNLVFNELILHSKDKSSKILDQNLNKLLNENKIQDYVSLAYLTSQNDTNTNFRVDERLRDILQEKFDIVISTGREYKSSDKISEDIIIIKELEKELNVKFEEVKHDEIFESYNSEFDNSYRAVYSIDSNNNVTGLCIVGLLKEIPKTIVKFSNLINLNLSYNEITNITSLQKLKKINNLHLQKNRIKDISPIHDLIEIKELVLNDNEIIDISVLKNIKKIKKLYLANNHIKEISALSELSQLENIGFYNNEINDISALSKLKNIKWIFIGKNNIVDISPIKELFNKEDISYNFDDNPITNPPIKIVKQGKGAIKNWFDSDIYNIGEIEKKIGKKLDPFIYNYSRERYINGYILNSDRFIERLCIFNNNLEEIPDEIFNFSKLKELDIRGNKISKLPKRILDLKLEIKWDVVGEKYDGIFLQDNPIKTPPIDIIKKGNKAIRDFMSSSFEYMKY
ncbi:MAG: hypothetical protein K8R68_00545, partial [Bacteroidales bacterium]|nr:hypothetical protein [Bacteroidales bacterium]